MAEGEAVAAAGWPRWHSDNAEPRGRAAQRAAWLHSEKTNAASDQPVDITSVCTLLLMVLRRLGSDETCKDAAADVGRSQEENCQASATRR